jgi:hypothetical protein
MNQDGNLKVLAQHIKRAQEGGGGWDVYCSGRVMDGWNALHLAAMGGKVYLCLCLCL